MHSFDTVASIKAKLLAEEYCSVDELEQAVKHLPTWFKTKTCDAILELLSTVGSNHGSNPHGANCSDLHQPAPPLRSASTVPDGHVWVRATSEEGDVTLTHRFPRLPTFKQLEAILRPSGGVKIFFKSTNKGKYTRVTNDEELLWAGFFQAEVGLYCARLAQSTPSSSPEKVSDTGVLLAWDCRLLGVVMFSVPVISHCNIEQDASRLAALCFAAQRLPPSEQGDELSAYDLGLLFPAQHLSPVAKTVAEGVARNWQNWLAVQREKRRTIASFAAAGASGTGKTRFGTECAALLLAQLRMTNADAALIAAMEQCVRRGLTLRYECRDASTRSADVLWNAYISRPGFMLPSEPRPPPLNGVGDVYEAVAAVERRWLPCDDVIAVVVHLDEVQHISALRLGQLLSALLEPFDDRGPPPYKIFPIVYFSGTDQLQVHATKSSRPPDLLPLPLLTCNDYIAICRSLFSSLPVSFPSDAMRRAFSSVEGPPRLFLLLLWALQARSAIVHGNLLEPATTVRRSRIAEALATTDDARVSHALDRAVRSLPHAQVPVFIESLRDQTTRLLCALALLAEPVQLADRIDQNTSVTEAISHGYAQSMPGSIVGQVILHWPRLYIWYFQRYMSAPEDMKPPLPMPPNAGTPTRESARAHESGAARNEEADIQLLCLRLFCQRELCNWRGKQVCPLRLLLPIADLGDMGNLLVKLPDANTMVRPHRANGAISSDQDLSQLLNGPLPVALVNRPITSFADSILLLELVGDAPAAIARGSVHRNKLAIFIQSKKHVEQQQHVGERFTLEYNKCASIKCVAWIFVMISDADHVVHRIPMPWKDNGFFVGREELDKFYGSALYQIRTEEWGRTRSIAP